MDLLKKKIIPVLVFVVALCVFITGCTNGSKSLNGKWRVCGFVYNGEDISVKDSQNLQYYPSKLSLFYAEMKLTFFDNGKVVFQRPALESEQSTSPQKLEATYEEEDGTILLDLDGDTTIMELEENVIIWEVSDSLIVKFKK